MEAQQFLIDLFRFTRSMILNVTVVQVVVFLLLARVISASAKPQECARAVFYYIMQAVAILLMSLAAIPTGIAALSNEGFKPETYLGLLIVFAASGILYLWNDQHIREIPEESKRISKLLYLYTLKTVGTLAIIFALLDLSLKIILNDATVIQANWLVVPIVMLIYGSIVCWAISDQSPAKVLTAKKAPAKRTKKKK